MAPNCCSNCDVKVTRTSKALQCQICDGWSHIRCIGVTEALYEHLVELQLQCLPYICRRCHPTITTARQTSKTTQSSTEVNPKEQESWVTVVKKTMKPQGKISKTLTKKSAENDLEVTCIPNIATTHPPSSAEMSSDADSPTAAVTQRPVDLAVPDPRPVTSTPKKNSRKKNTKTTKAIETPNEINPSVESSTDCSTIRCSIGAVKRPTESRRPPRDRCLIVLNIPESTADTAQDRVDHDVCMLRACLQSIFNEDEQKVASSIKLMMAFRLGQRRENPEQNARPLKIILNSAEEVQSILQRAHRLKGQPIRILRDLSPEDRVKLKAALTELRERRANGETNLFVKDFRVVKRKPRIRWSPLSLNTRPRDQ